MFGLNMAFITVNPFHIKPPSSIQPSHSISMCTISYRSTFRNEIQRARDFLTQRAVQQVSFAFHYCYVLIFFFHCRFYIVLIFSCLNIILLLLLDNVLCENVKR